MRKNIFYLSFFLCLLFTQAVWAQVPTYRGIKTSERHSYNFAPDAFISPRLRKSKELRIVYSDRANNPAFTSPYAQKMTEVQKLGTAYYIIGEENGHYELVVANPKNIGKPKGLFGFLHSRHRHFKEAGSVEYVGWIPKNKLLLYNHAFVSSENHLPRRFQIGVTNTKRLYDLHRHLKEDSLSIYTDPYLKEKLPQKLIMGGFAYVYKYDETGQAALVSDKPSINAETKQILGWIPSDMVAYVGQNHCFKEKGHTDNSLVKGELLKQRSDSDVQDSISFRFQDLQSQLLFAQAQRHQSGNDSLDSKDWAINIPFSVWDHGKNKLINVKGGEIPIRIIKQMARGQKRINIHLLYFEQERSEVKRLINSFQSIALKTKPNKSYTYSATVISEQGNRYLESTENFATWLDFLLNETKAKSETGQGLSVALRHFVQRTEPDIFEANLFLLLGSTQELSLSTSLLNSLAERSAGLVILQPDNGAGESHQDFLLQGKELLAQYINQSNDYLSNYIVDPTIVKSSIFSDYSREASIYLLDVPHNSLTIGGIAFPAAGKQLSNVALETVIDTLARHIELRNDLLLKSLVRYEKKLGVLRSELSYPLVQLYERAGQKDSIADIDRNASSDTYYETIWMPDSTLRKTHTEGYLYTVDEVKGLIQNYRALLPLFADRLGKRELRMLRHLYEKERELINTRNYRELVTRRASIATLFYHKTGIWPNDTLLYKLRPCNLHPKRTQSVNWEEHYQRCLHKLNALEQDFINERLSVKEIAGTSYYFISKEQLP